MIILPLVNLNLATFLRAEFGFLGFLIRTRKQIPFFWGLFSNAGVLTFFIAFFDFSPWLYHFIF